MAPYAGIEIHRGDTNIDEVSPDYTVQSRMFSLIASGLARESRSAKLIGLFNMWSNISEDSPYMYDYVHGIYFGEYDIDFYRGKYMVVPTKISPEERTYTVIKSGLGIYTATLSFDPRKRKVSSMKNQIIGTILDRKNPHVAPKDQPVQALKIGTLAQEELSQLLLSDSTYEAIREEAASPINLV